MKANELKELLAKEARGVCLELLGRSGKIEGGEFVVGDIHGSPGKSLKVRLTGSKAGVWCDFAAGMGGDLIDLAMATRSYTLSQACRWAENYLHIPSDYQDKRPVAIKPKATYTRAAVPKVTLFPDAVKQYLVDERKITEETLRTFGIYGEGENMCFPSYVDDVCYMIKYISIHRDEKGHKKISTSANSEPCLFGWQALTGKEREIIICEGEIDCMSWHQYGHAALSVPRGAGEGNQVSWIEAEYDNLARFDTIYLSFDDDEVGHKCTNEVLNRLGKERCKIIELPFKDCNELLKKGYWKEHIDQIVAKATYRDPVELKQLSNYRDKAYLVAHPELVEDKGIKLEIGNDVGMHFKASEVTLWSGINGHGKSMVLNQLMLDTIRQGKDICIASLEVKPEVMLAKMVRQASGCRCPSDEEFHRIVDWLGNKICVFDFVGE
ncbi:MAG: toprim domain-containing protein, partial [Bacilli bacterium]